MEDQSQASAPVRFLSSAASSRRRSRRSLDEVICDPYVTLEIIPELELSSMDLQITISILDAGLELLRLIHAKPPTCGVESSPHHPAAAAASQEPGPFTSASGPSIAAGSRGLPHAQLLLPLPPRAARQCSIFNLMMLSSSCHMAEDAWWSSSMCVIATIYVCVTLDSCGPGYVVVNVHFEL